MPDKVHEIKIRSNQLLLTLHEILILVLKYSISLHDACKNKKDLNVGLAEVIAANTKKFDKNKSIQKNAHYKKYFYDVNGKLKNSIEIKKLDISVLVILIKIKFISSSSTSANSLFLQSRCCVDCIHDKCFCGVKVDPDISCKKKANCGYIACASGLCFPSMNWKCSIDCKHQQGCSTGINAASSSECSNPRNCQKMGCPCPSSTKCDFIIMKRYIDVAAFFRNCISHVTYDGCCDLEDGKPAFDEFPLCKSWKEVWEVVNKASLDCLKVLSNNTYIQKDDYKDYEMRLRISLKEDIKHLLDVVSNDIQNCFQVIFGEEKNYEQMKNYKIVLDDLCNSMYSYFIDFL